MDDNSVARKKVQSILLERNITDPNFDVIVKVIENYGFDIIDYSYSGRKDSANELINELSLQKYAEAGKAFTYQQGDVKLVFVLDTLPPDEIKYALAHELGHIACGHLENGNKEMSITEEYEANEFAHYFLNPDMAVKISNILRKNKMLSIGLASVLVVVIAVVAITNSRANEEIYYKDYYITSSGEKYHQKDCYFIRDKDNVHRLTIEEYNSGQYEPCQVCLTGKLFE